jgi:hypothetical protein
MPQQTIKIHLQRQEKTNTRIGHSTMAMPCIGRQRRAPPLPLPLPSQCTINSMAPSLPLPLTVRRHPRHCLCGCIVPLTCLPLLPSPSQCAWMSSSRQPLLCAAEQVEPAATHCPLLPRLLDQCGTVLPTKG